MAHLKRATKKLQDITSNTKLTVHRGLWGYSIDNGEAHQVRTVYKTVEELLTAAGKARRELSLLKNAVARRTVNELDAALKKFD